MNALLPQTAANPRKTRGLRQLGPVSIDALVAAVQNIPDEVWEAENAAKPNRFGVLDKTRHIVFRFVGGPCDWRGSHDRPAWQSWRSMLEPVLAEAVRSYGYASGAFPRVMLAKMPPGGVIHPHIDTSPAAKWPHKVHVPLLTNPGVISFFGGAERRLPAGQAVEVDNLSLHWVKNTGQTSRVHLIFEYYDADQPDPDWLEPLMRHTVAER